MPKIILKQKQSGETINQVFDFTSFVASGVTVSSAVCSCFVFSGTDSSPSSVLSGNPSYSGATVTQALTGGVSGVVYLISCTATCSDSSIIILSGYLAIQP